MIQVRNLTKTFKSCNLRLRAKLLDGFQPFVFTIAVTCDEVAFLLVLVLCLCLCHDSLVLYLCLLVPNAE